MCYTRKQAIKNGDKAFVMSIVISRIMIAKDFVMNGCRKRNYDSPVPSLTYVISLVPLTNGTTMNRDNPRINFSLPVVERVRGFEAR